jgi:hypothetical protein
VPETSYAPCGDLSLAYQVFGDGPIELVFVGSDTDATDADASALDPTFTSCLSYS